MSMTTGLVFDIREFTVHDGPGLRTTVFMKGCPLACMWCHNPEGQSSKPQMMVSAAGRRLAGTLHTSQALAALLKRQAPIFRASGGGVTFSGGEPLMQAAFIAQVVDLLDGIHVLLDTSGDGPTLEFERLLLRVQLVHYDLKLIDPAAHRRYTGGENRLILANLEALERSGIPYIVRVPLVPGVTDTDTNLAAIAETVQGRGGMRRVELLPYNRHAGAKYAAAGKRFEPDYDENQPVRAHVALFEERGIKVCVG